MAYRGNRTVDLAHRRLANPTVTDNAILLLLSYTSKQKVHIDRLQNVHMEGSSGNY